MAVCSSCGKENREEAQFCVYCGKPLSRERKTEIPGGEPRGEGESHPGSTPAAGGPVPPPQPPGTVPPSPPPPRQVSPTSPPPGSPYSAPAGSPPAPPGGPVPPPAPGTGERPGRRRVLLWLVPVILLLAVAGVVVALLLLRDSRASLEAYKDEAGEIHGRTGEELSDLGTDMGEAVTSVEDSEDLQQILKAFEEVEGLLEDSVSLLEDSQEELEELKPPKKAEAFHDRLLDFYERCRREYEDALSTMTYCVEVFTVMNDATEAILGFAGTEPQSTEEALQFIDSMDGICREAGDRLQEEAPPAGLEDFHRRLLVNWDELLDIIAKMRAAVYAGDVGEVTSIGSRLEGWEAELNSLGEELSQSFVELGERIMDLGEEGADLAEELEAL